MLCCYGYFEGLREGWSVDLKWSKIIIIHLKSWMFRHDLIITCIKQAINSATNFSGTGRGLHWFCPEIPSGFWWISTTCGPRGRRFGASEVHRIIGQRSGEANFETLHNKYCRASHTGDAGRGRGRERERGMSSELANMTCWGSAAYLGAMLAQLGAMLAHLEAMLAYAYAHKVL